VDSNSRIFVIGASAGGVEALLGLGPRLSTGFAAPILVVLHIGAHRSLLPDLLNKHGPNRAVFAQTGVEPRPGMIYVAPPDHHLLLEGGLLRLFRGPKENHARPAINPLFRSAALDSGPRVVGVLITGMLDDGTAGLRAIKACGGIAVVQDPHGACEPSMPRSALAAVAVDYVAKLDAMAGLLNSLASPVEPAVPVPAPEWLRTEHAISLGKKNMGDLATIGVPSPFTCPDCGGALFELHEGPMRFLCHTGHAFSLRSLASTQEQVADEALWSGLRALQEKEFILRRLAEEQVKQAPDLADAARREAAKLAAFIEQMRGVVSSAPPTMPVEDAGGLPEKPAVES
jgi:two-component system chemotaxis response regulator CheB